MIEHNIKILDQQNQITFEGKPPIQFQKEKCKGSLTFSVFRFTPSYLRSIGRLSILLVWMSKVTNFAY